MSILNNFSVPITVIVPAAGIGQRFGASLPKQYTQIRNLTILQHTLTIFVKNQFIHKIIVAVSPEDNFPKYQNDKITYVIGGKTRFESVLNCLEYLQNITFDAKGWVLVHDAVRCCLHSNDLNNLLDTLYDDEIGGILVSLMTDTVKQYDSVSNTIKNTIDRSQLVKALTPQMFRFGALFQAYRLCLVHGIIPTDESQAVEQLGFSPKVVFADHPNPKITYPSDIQFAENLLTDPAKLPLKYCYSSKKHSKTP